MQPEISNIFQPSTQQSVEKWLAIKSFKHFCRYFWPQVAPGEQLFWGPSQDAIASHMEAVQRGDIKRLIICVPPRSLKSTMVSVLFPAWLWLHNPTEKFISTSYAMQLATRDSVRSRTLMKSAPYQELLDLLPEERRFTFSNDQNLKHRYENDRHGHRIATSTGGSITGEGAGFILVDDAMKAQEADSTLVQFATQEWFDKALSTRLNNQRTGAIVIIAQRLSVKDLIGNLLEKQGGIGRKPGDKDSSKYTVLCIQGIYEPTMHPLVNSPEHPTTIGWVDPRHEAWANGAVWPNPHLLMSEFLGIEGINTLKRTLGEAHFSAQYQQFPGVQDGALFKERHLRYYGQESLPDRFEKTVISFDLKFGGTAKEVMHEFKTGGSYAVGQVWGLQKGLYYLIDERRGLWDMIESIEQAKQLKRDYPLGQIIVENKASGPAFLNMAKSDLPGMIAVEPKGSKLERAQPIAALFRSHLVLVPKIEEQPWVEAWRDEVISFPNHRFEDRVDSMTQALDYLVGTTKVNGASRLAMMNRRSE